MNNERRKELNKLHARIVNMQAELIAQIEALSSVNDQFTAALEAIDNATL